MRPAWPSVLAISVCVFFLGALYGQHFLPHVLTEVQLQRVADLSSLAHPDPGGHPSSMATTTDTYTSSTFDQLAAALLPLGWHLQRTEDNQVSEVRAFGISTGGHTTQLGPLLRDWRVELVASGGKPLDFLRDSLASTLALLAEQLSAVVQEVHFEGTGLEPNLVGHLQVHLVCVAGPAPEER